MRVNQVHHLRGPTICNPVSTFLTPHLFIEVGAVGHEVVVCRREDLVMLGPCGVGKSVEELRWEFHETNPANSVIGYRHVEGTIMDDTFRAQHEAVVDIQSAIRGSLRRQSARRLMAACDIQSAIRGCMQTNSTSRTMAASHLQSALRSVPDPKFP